MNGVAGGVQRSTTDDEAFYRTTRDALEVDEEGIEMSSAPVTYSEADRKGKGVVRKVESDDAEGPGELRCLPDLDRGQVDQSMTHVTVGCSV